MVDIPEYVAKEELDTDRRGMPQPELMSGQGVGYEMLGKALQDAGSVVARFANNSDKGDATEANYAFEDFKAATLLHEQETTRNAPSSGAGIHDQNMQWMDKKIEEVAGGLAPKYQKEFRHRANIWRTDRSIQTSNQEWEQNKGFQSDSLSKIVGDDSAELVNHPEKWQEFRDKNYKYIEQMPNLTEADRDELRAKVDNGLAIGRSAGKRKIDPSGAKSDLGFPVKPDPNKRLSIRLGTQPGRLPPVLEGTNPKVIDMWEQVQGAVGFRASVVSAHRTVARNRLAGGAKGSQHIHGNALDIDLRGLSEQQKVSLIRAASAAGFGGINVYPSGNSMHIDIGSKRHWTSQPSWAQQAIADHEAGKTSTQIPYGTLGGSQPTTIPPAGRGPMGIYEPTGATNLPRPDFEAASTEQLTLVSNKEAIRYEPYEDGKNPDGSTRYSIGFGSDEVTFKDGSHRKVQQGDRITEEDAQRDLKRRLPQFTTRVKSQIGLSAWNRLSKGAKTALPSVAYNLGSLPKSVVSAAKEGTNEDIASAVAALRQNPGRRREEAEIILGTREVGAYNPQGRTGESGGGYTQVASVTEGTPGEVTPTESAPVDPAYRGTTVEWRLQELNRIEAEEKEQAQERQKAAVIQLNEKMKDSLAAYETSGEYTLGDPDIELFMSADPEDGERRYKEYEVARAAAKTVYNIQNMDISDVRKEVTKWRDMVPKGELADVYFRAYESIASSAEKQEQKFEGKVSEIRRRLKLKLDEENDQLAEGLRLREVQQRHLDEEQSTIRGETIEERHAQRQEEERRMQEGIAFANETVKDIQKRKLDEAKLRVSRSDDIVYNLEHKGGSGVSFEEEPKLSDFVRVDPIEGPRKWIEYQQKYMSAIAVSKYSNYDDAQLAAEEAKFYQSVGSKAEEDGEKIALDAIDRIRKKRTEDPLAAAKDQSSAVRDAWKEAEQDSSDPIKLNKAVNLTLEIQKDWGMPIESLAILPPYTAKTVAAHFNDTTGERTAGANQNELIGLLDVFQDNDEAKLAIMGQLIRAGVPKENMVAVDAYMAGATEASQARLFDAARKTDPVKGEEDETATNIKQAVRDKLLDRGGREFYNLATGTDYSMTRFNDAVSVLTRAASRRIFDQEGQDEAIDHAIDDLMDGQEPFTTNLTSGPSVSVMNVPTDTNAEAERGFNRASKMAAESLNEGINTAEARGPGVEFPALGETPVTTIVSPRREGDTRKLEFWPPGEEGAAEAKRPKDLPIGEPGVEVFDRSVTPLDIAGDIVSHYLVEKDPKLKGYYDQFKKSLTPTQDKQLQEQYNYAKQNEGETRSFEQWRETSGLPALFRGYAFRQYPEKSYGVLYTTEQRNMLDEMMQYVGTPKFALNRLATEAYQLRLRKQSDEILENSVWIEYNKQYALFNKNTRKFVPNNRTGGPFTITKQQLIELSRPRAEDTRAYPRSLYGP